MMKLFDIEIKQADDILLENTAKGDLLISPIIGGTFYGRINGEVRPIGICSTYTPDPGVNIINTPAVLATEDGADILMHIKAYLHLKPELEERFLSGDKVPPDQYYYKGTVSFDTGDEKYKWLENRVFTCESVIENWELVKFAVYEG